MARKDGEKKYSLLVIPAIPAASGSAEELLQWSEIFLLKPNVILSLTKGVIPATSGPDNTLLV